MGFSIENFFNQLLGLLEDSDKTGLGDAQSDLRRIYEFVVEEQKYAKECGVIR